MNTSLAFGTSKPRLGFLGVGWIGYQRMMSIVDSGAAEAVAVADPDDSLVRKAIANLPKAKPAASLDELLTYQLDGIVIATPSALHAQQSIAALRSGLAVFCQKPLGRDASEVCAVIEAARSANRLLAIDLSYRFTDALQKIRALIESESLGNIFSLDLAFHNAYGPQKPWFYDPQKSGGGCLIDLGIHLVDIVFWLLPSAKVAHVHGRLFHKGQPVKAHSGICEDYALAFIELENGAVINLSCSWHLHAGQDAIIGIAVHGANGGAAMRNVDGSFTAFVADHFTATSRHRLSSPPDDWGGRAAIAWARQLSKSASYDPANEATTLQVANTLDAIYRSTELA